MATDEDPPTRPARDADWSESSQFVSDTEYYDLLIQHAPDLLIMVDMKPLKVYLFKYKVVDEIMWQTIEACGPNFQQVDALIDHLKRGDMRRYHGFIQSLRESNQSHIADILDPQIGAREDDQLMQAIEEHCESYNRNLLKSPLMDISRDKYHDLRHTFINLHVHLDTKGGKNQELVPIPGEAIFRVHQDSPPPCSVLLSGGVGHGKTSFIKSSIHKWCRTQLNKSLKKEIMIYVPAASISGDVLRAIYSNIFCKTKEKKEKLFKFVMSGSEDVHIFLDGVDEVRDKVTLRNIRKFVEDCKNNGAPVVLVSTRDNLAGVDNLSFNRHLQIDGFTIDQGLEYVDKWISRQEDKELLQHLEKGRNTPDIRAILKNPLRLHMLCVAIEHGLLQIKDVANLRISHLYNMLEGLVNTREETKSESLSSVQNMNRNFYRMYLYSVLCGKADITKDLLSLFNLDEACPMLRLLTKTCVGMSRSGETQYIYTAPHESYLEFCCSQGILSLEGNIRRLILMFLCSRVEWFNIQLMTYGALALQEDQGSVMQVSELSSFIRYMMVLIPERAVRQTKDLCLLSLHKAGAELSELKEKMIHSPDSDRYSLHTLIMDQQCPEDLIQRATHLHDEMSNMFDREYQCIRDNAWFDTMRVVTSKHIHQCLVQSLPHQLTEVAGNTLGRILPCQIAEWRTFYHIPGTARLGDIDRHQDITTWTPHDALTLLEQWTTSCSLQPHPTTQTPTTSQTQNDEVGLYCFCYKTQFGDQPDDEYSPACWGELLTAPTKGLYRTVRVVLGDLAFTCLSSSDIECEPERNRVLPVLQALISSYREISNAGLEEIRVWYGYIYLGDLNSMMRELERLMQAGKVRVVLEEPYVVIEESDRENVTRQEEIMRIQNSGMVKNPLWFTPQGTRIRDI